MMESLSPDQVAKLADAVASRLLATPTKATPSQETPSLFARPAAQAERRSAVSLLKRSEESRVVRPVVLPSVYKSTAATEHSAVAYQTLDQAVEAAQRALPSWIAIPLEKKKVIIAEMREVLRRNVDDISRLAVEETGLGRVQDKNSKNLLVTNKTPGPEFLQPTAYTGDDGLALIEYAPYGVIGAITPCTNPSETIINNAISMLSASNVIVFNPHPSAKRVSQRTMELMDHVIVANGGPRGCLTMVEEPNIESAQQLMKHKGIRLLVVTGGPVVAHAAMGSGKKAIVAGPGNPPVVVDETADLTQAAVGIINGASLDNNIVCIAEKEIIAVESIADDLVAKLKAAGAFHLSSYQTKQLEKVMIEYDDKNEPHSKKEFVGKNVGRILEKIGLSVSDETRLAFCEVDEGNPFVQLEMLTPVIPLVRVRNVADAIEMAVRVEHGNRHTSVMYSKNIDHLHAMAKAVDSSIFVKNAPSYAGLGLGGEGYTSFTIASPTGEGLTNCRTFSRIRRCTLKDHFRIV